MNQTPIKPLTGIVVHGYQLSGWRRDEHGWYRIWLTVKGPIMAASLLTGNLACPDRALKTGHACKRGNMRKGTVKESKRRADAWLADTIAQVTK